MRYRISLGFIVWILAIDVALGINNADYEADAITHSVSHANHTIWDIFVSNPNLYHARKAFEHTGLKDLLSGLEPMLTVFAPDNHAFLRLSNELKEYFRNDSHREELVAVGLYHMVQGIYSSATFKDKMGLSSLTGIPLQLFLRDLFTNTTIASINHATIVSRDLVAANGVVHIIDAVLLPNKFSINQSSDSSKNMTVAEVISQHKELEKFKRALQNTGLLDYLDSTDSLFTVFAPINRAWQGAYLKLLHPENNSTLHDAMQYHIVRGGAHYSINFCDNTHLKTKLGKDLVVTRKTFLPSSSDAIYVDNAQVIRYNVVARNGVIHLIDRVLLPSGAS